VRGTSSSPVSSPLPAALPAALCAVLAACGATTTTQVGGPCEASGACDDGQVCDRTAPGGAVCLDAAGDVDGDGIPNGKDFCEHAAGGDHDEDLDGIGDECDPCPIARPPASADSDGDAVDGTCDPDPRTPGDKIILFNGFNAPVAGAGADWKFQGGEAIVTPAAPDTVEQLVFPLARATNHMAILAAYRIDGVASGAASADAAVISKTVLPLGTSVIQCGGSRAGGSDAVLLKTDANGSANETSKMLINAFNPASQYRVAELLDGAAVNCAVAGDTMDNSGALQLASDGSTPTQAVLYARGATVRFSYILVIAR
jgi:hypothetical protein